jgi:hypothetical protein
MMTVRSSHAHQAFGTQDAIHGRKRDKEQSQIPRIHRQGAVGEVRIPFLHGHGRYSGAFLREKLVYRVLRARLAIFKAKASLPDPRPPDHTPPINHPHGTGADPGYSFGSGLLQAQKD